MSQLNSLAPVASQYVIEKANQTIEDIKNRRQRAREGFIRELMEPFHKSWWHKLFRRPMVSRTREEAIRFMKDVPRSIFDSDYWVSESYVESMYETQYRACRALIRLAEQSDVVYLSAEDFRLIN